MNTGRTNQIEYKTRIYVAGHTGLVGSAILRQLEKSGYTNRITAQREQVDLTIQTQVDAFFDRERPNVVILAAARVGGILANSTYPAAFIRDNLLIQTHVIDASFRFGVDRLVFLGSSCIYPRNSPQPITEEYLLSGKLEATNEAYAVAKIAGVKMCEAYNTQYGTHYLALMPTNLYGPGDNFDARTSHVLPALIRRFHEAKVHGLDSVTLWGTGQPKREFLYVDDLADATLFLMNQRDETRLINVGVGKDISIVELARLIAGVVGYQGLIEFDPSKPDGTPRKLLDVQRINRLGWQAKTDLVSGLRRTYSWFLTTH